MIGRFKSFPIQEDEHFFTACRYVERNALKAQVVERAEGLALGKPVGAAARRQGVAGPFERLAAGSVRGTGWHG